MNNLKRKDIEINLHQRNFNLICDKYNLKDKEVTVYTNTKDDLLFLSNPYKYSMTSFLMSDTGGVYYQVDMEVLPNLKSCLNDGVLSDRIKNKGVLKYITEDSNPIILYYEYKKE